MKTPSFFYKKTVLSWILFPFSFIYLFFHKLDWALKRIKKVKNTNNKKLICVGNIVVGGSGKTPFCTLLGGILSDKNFCFLSHGYKRKIKKDAFFKKNTEFYGDEMSDEGAILVKSGDLFLTQNRVKFNDLLHDIIVFDDGLSDAKIPYDIKFVLFDAKRGFGNGFLLPAGMLRMPINTVKKSDIIVVCNSSKKTELSDIFTENKIIYTEGIFNYEDFDENQKYIAFSGLGDNDKFFKSLGGFNVVRFIEFSDHFDYKKHDFDVLQNAAITNKSRLICTEKDFVKIKKFDANKIVDVLKIKFTLNTADMNFVKNLVCEGG